MPPREGPGESVERTEDIARAERLLERLPDLLARPMRLIYLEGRGLAETAQMIGVSQQWVSEMRMRAVARLREINKERSA